MTEKLYWDAPYETTFTAEVIEVTPEGIILDKTLFYPEGGNQISDKGVIFKGNNKFNVEHVSKKEGLFFPKTFMQLSNTSCRNIA